MAARKTETAAKMIEYAPAAELVEPNVAAFAETANQVREAFRANVEKGLAETRAVYEKAKVASEANVSAIEASLEAVKTGAERLSEKAIESARAHFDANLAFAKSALSAKSAADVFALQSQFARSAFEALGSQAKEMGTLAQKIAADAAKPLNTRFVEAVKTTA